eukprot:205810_1
MALFFFSLCMLTIQSYASTVPNYGNYAKICNITDKPYSAEGNGKADNTKAIQLAINDCSNASNTSYRSLVVLPKYYSNNAQTVYMSSALWLQSNIDIYFEENVKLYGVPCVNASINNISYPYVYTRHNGIMSYAHSGLINGGICKSIHYNASTYGDQCKKWKKLENIKIFGNGIIDGNGHSGWAPNDPNRPYLLDLLWINHLKIYNITLTNSPCWTCHPCFCSNVIIDNITISTDGSNTDGIDPDSCKNVLIQNSYISTGDDCIAIKSGRDEDGRAVNISSNNITVRNMRFGNGHGISIGSEMSGNVTNVLFDGLFMDGTNDGPRIKSAPCRGGKVVNITYKNIVMEGVQTGIALTKQRNDCANKTIVFPEFTNIFYQNITGTATKQAGSFICLEQSPCYDVYLKDVNITANDGFECQYVHGQSVDVEPKSCVDN